MKTLLLAGGAVLLLVTGRAHAKDVDMCVGPHATEIPCAELGNEFMCGKSDIDTVYIRTDHLLSDLSAHTNHGSNPVEAIPQRQALSRDPL